jgi:hypothetical protein
MMATGLVQVRAETPIKEYQLKAVFLLNFAKFIAWPTTAFANAGTPFQICVLGENPFGSSLENIVRGMNVAGRSFAIRSVSAGRQAAGCHILFVGASERQRSRAVMAEIKGAGILTVGETNDFLANGGVIQFKLKDAQLRFEIDADAAVREDLKISSKLLSLGDARAKR